MGGERARTDPGVPPPPGHLLRGHERLDQAEVSWPDGKKELLTNLAVDRFYVVREGRGVISSTPPEHRVKLP